MEMIAANFITELWSSEEFVKLSRCFLVKRISLINLGNWWLFLTAGIFFTSMLDMVEYKLAFSWRLLQGIRTCRANFSTTPSARNPYLFDTHEFVTKLESEGFTRQQSETIVTCLHDVMSESFDNLASGLVTKEQQEKLKSEIQMLEKNDFAVMKSENEKLAGEVEKLKRRLKDEISRAQAGVRLDMNLEKGRLRNEASQQTSKLNDSQAKIEQEIYNLRAQMENIKFQILQYMVGTITGTSALILGTFIWRSYTDHI